MALAMVAMVATSCAKDDVTKSVSISGEQKSVKFSLENVINTRSVDGMISAAKVTLNDCQVFFVGADGSLYNGKNSDGTEEATQYFTTIPTETLAFHFLPAEVEKVVVVGNYGSEITPANLNAIKAIATEAAAQQLDENLLVYGEAELVALNDGSDHGNSYKAEVSVKPLVSRIEIGGFVCEFSDTPLYEQVDITMVALNNYYNNATIGGTLSNYSSTAISSSSVYPFFNDTTAPAYSKDVVSGVSLTPAAPSVDFDMEDEYIVYHTFAGDIPQLVVRITGTKSGSASPLYLATSAFYDGATKIEEFEAGKVYRMKFNGENRFAFEDTDLNQPEKCVQVTIETADWVIVNVTPEF
jgi:hypothetical protein